MNSESAAMCDGGDACVKKTASMWARHVRAVFFGMCAGKHRKGSPEGIPLGRFREALFASFSGIREIRETISLLKLDTILLLASLGLFFYVGLNLKRREE